MDKVLNVLERELPGFKERREKYLPLANVLLTSLQSTNKELLQTLQKGARGEELTFEQAVSLSDTINFLEALRDIFVHATPPTDVQLQEAADRAIEKLGVTCTDFVDVHMDVYGWETIHFSWSSALSVPAELVKDGKLDEEFIEAFDEERKGVAVDYANTELSDREECEVAFTVDRDCRDES